MRGERGTSRVRGALAAVSLSHFPDRKYAVMLAAPLARSQPGSGEEADCVRLGSGLPIWGWKETARFAEGKGGGRKKQAVALRGQQSEINPGDLASPLPKVLASLQCWQTNSKGEGIHGPGLFCHSPRVRRSAWRRGTRLRRSTALRENPYSCGFLDLPFCCCRRDVLLLSQQHGDLPGQSLWRVGSWV